MAGDGDANFDCSICMEKASEPVVTQCGHLFCWPCLAEWLRRAQDCPVCKAGCTRETVIPLYGKGSSRAAGEQAGSSAAPEGAARPAPPSPSAPRPQANRPPTPPRRQAMPDFSFQFGPAFFFPFLFWNEAQPARPMEWNDEMKSKVALYIGLLILLYLIVLPM